MRFKSNWLIRELKNNMEQKKQQQLQVKLKNIPVDASQVHCAISSGLNKEETLSVQSKVRACNNLDVNIHRKMRQNTSVSVYVLNMRGQPLMPTTPKKARIVLKQNKAKVTKRTPFTIQLTHQTGEAKQNITLGIDSGYKYVGFSGATKERELISGELTLRTDIRKKLQDRAMYRRTRRSRLWHRQPRFNNRNRKENWFAPSIEHKVQTHIRLIQKIKAILPISNTIMEIANFDTQKMQNPEISNKEYQQGELQGYEIREYLLEKWGRKCAYCNKKNIPLEIEHIIPKSRGGSNRVSNLTLACNKCNLKKGKQTAEEFGFPNIQKQAKQSLKATMFMNIVKKRIVKELNCDYTYGYITKHNRIKANIEKSHSNDAFVIAKGNTQQRTMPFTCGQVRRNNRKLQTNRKGFRPSIRRQRYDYHPYDLISIDNNIHVVKGIFNHGSYIRSISMNGGIINTNIRNVRLIQYGAGI